MAVKLTGRDAARIKSDFDPPTAAPRTAAQTGRGRPKKRQEETKTVCFRLPVSIVKRLRVYAVMNEKTPADVLCEFVEGLELKGLE